MPKMIENDRKTLKKRLQNTSKIRFWETTAIATHENKEQLMTQ